MSLNSVLIINGPNLNLLGMRQPEFYGDMTFEAFLSDLKKRFDGCSIYYFQSNHEGRLIDKLHEYGFENNTGIVINAGAYTHSSIALGDAVEAIQVPVVEVHITDIENREAFRHHSYIKSHAAHFISGKGLQGYVEAIEYFLSL